MTAWKTLDLRQRKTYGPHDGELIVLHMIPKSAWGRSRAVSHRPPPDGGRQNLDAQRRGRGLPR